MAKTKTKTENTKTKAKKPAKTKTAKRPMHVAFLLDETGSMNRVKDDTLGGFNEFVGQLRRDKALGAVTFTCIKFDSNRFEPLCECVPIGKVPELTEDNYRPGALTPLVESAIKLIERTNHDVADRKDNPLVHIVLQTDGLENASNAAAGFTTVKLADLIRNRTGAGWLFTFLGCDVDAYSQAAQFGMADKDVAQYGLQQSGAAFDSAAARTRAFHRTGDAGKTEFTVAQKRAMGDPTAGREDSGEILSSADIAD